MKLLQECKNKTYIALFSLISVCFSTYSFAHVIPVSITGDYSYDLTEFSSGSTSHGLVLSTGNGPNIIGITAWANTGSTAGGTPSGALEEARAMFWGSNGFGVENNGNLGNDTGYPQYTLDNEGAYDSLVFEFASDIILSEIDISFYVSDADISVLAYAGTNTPATLEGQSYNDLLNNGWLLTDNINNLQDTGFRAAVNRGSSSADPVASSFWLIGAYNPLISGTQAWDANDDYVKLLNLYGTAPTPVTEPGVLLLMLTGIALVLWQKIIGRRRDLNYPK